MPHYALVTGASAGIGEEIAIQLAEKGTYVIAVGRNSERLEKIKLRFPNIHPVTADITTAAGLDAIYAACHGKQLAYVIHSAAVLEPFGSLSDVRKTSKAAYDTHTATNVTAPIALTKHLEPQLKNGRVLFLGSYFAHKTTEELKSWTHCFGAYCESKNALYTEVQKLQPELSNAGITTHYAIPGSVNTQLFQQFWQEAQSLSLKPGQAITAKESAAFIVGVVLTSPLPAEPSKIWDYKKDLQQSASADSGKWQTLVATTPQVARSRL